MSTTRPSDEPGTVWWFWADGAAAAPPIVRRCLESVIDTFGSDRVTVLDRHTYRDFVDLPTHLEDRRERMGWTHFSDILRTYLLCEHGGTWVDSTIFMSARPPSDLSSLPLFAFTRPEDPFVLSSWYLQATAQHPLMLAIRGQLTDYWSERDELVDYFLFHFMVEAAVTTRRDLRRLWMAFQCARLNPPMSYSTS